MKQFLIYCLIFVGLNSCKLKPDEITPTTVYPDWTEASHGNHASPNYDEVFPQNKVNSLEITLSKAQWDSIKVDMKTRSGKDFGVGGGIGGGGAPGGGMGGGLDLIPGDPIYMPVSVKYNGKEWYKVGFRLKGNSSLSQAWSAGNYKLPFKIQFDEFEDKYPDLKNQRFFGFKEFSFSPGHNDNSLIKEKIVADLFREAGIPAANTAFYKVYINFGAGLKYCGVYTMVEVIDDSMVPNQFGDKKGNIYKPESNMTSFVQTQFEKKNNETEADFSDVKKLIEVLNSATRTSNPSQWRADLEKIFDVQHYLKYLAINNSIVNWDTYGAIAHNYYLYNHNGKIKWIPWDHNLSMTATGGGGIGGGSRGAVSIEMTDVGSQWPLIRNVAAQEIYYTAYKNFAKEFITNHLTSAKMNSIIDKHVALISPFVIGAEPEVNGYTYLKSTSDFENGISSMKSHITTRNQKVNEFVNK
jgi:spore coat protein H